MSPSVVLTPFETYTVTSGKATPLVYGDRDNPQPGLIINLDLTHIMTIGDDLGVTVNRTDSATIQPLQAVAYDGTRNIYGIMPSGQTALIEVAPGLTYWAPSPAQISAQISALGLATQATQLTVAANTGTAASNTGTTATNTAATTSALTTGIALPVGAAKDTSVVGVNNAVTAQTGLGKTIGQDVYNNGVPLHQNAANPSTGSGTLTAGGNVTLGPFSLDQTGYWINLGAESNAGSAAPIITALIKWFDNSSNLIAQELWALAGGSGVFNQYLGVGPTEGSSVTITLTNLDAALTASYNYAISFNSCVYLRHNWTNSTFNPVPGFTRASTEQFEDVLFQTIPTIGAASTATRLLPLFNGNVGININNTAEPNTLTVSIFVIDALWVGGNSAVVFGPVTIAAGGSTVAPYMVPFPKACMAIQMTNNGATGSITPGINGFIIRSPV